jgi:hypothetical protein
MKHELLRFVDFSQMKPVDYARMWYGLFCEVPWEDDLKEYMRNGCVVARPTCLMLFRPANIAKEGEPEDLAWYIRFSYGNLLELLYAFPAYLPKLAFYRAGPLKPKKNRLHVVSYDRMVRLTEARFNQGKQYGQD